MVLGVGPLLQKISQLLVINLGLQEVKRWAFLKELILNTKKLKQVFQVLEFELRKAHETIKALRGSLTEATGNFLSRFTFIENHNMI